MKAAVVLRLSDHNLVYCGALHYSRTMTGSGCKKDDGSIGNQRRHNRKDGQLSRATSQLSNYVEKYHDCDQIVSILTTPVLGLVMKLVLE
jgi:hypothetical protein